jgi:hypothetical protein
MRTPERRFVTVLAFIAGLAVAAPPVDAANIVINNLDPPGEGFNDPTPATPVGGNPGTTLGEQRLIVFETAAMLWGATLESDVDIVVQAIFTPLSCTPTAGVLGAAGTIQIFAFSEAPPPVLTDTWYHSALANKLVGVDLTPGPLDPGFLEPPYNDDIFALFNSALGTEGCLEGSAWYYGLDNQNAPNELDLLTVVMHEFAHGLGFSDFTDEETGELFSGIPSVYGTNMYDTTLDKAWPEMTDAERLAAQVDTGHLVWVGGEANAQARELLTSRPTVGVIAPLRRGALFEAQAASFGHPLRPWRGPFGRILLVNDGEGERTDGCEPIMTDVWGRIALIDRGGCPFTTKVKNAQDAGADGAIIANNVPGGLPPMSGSDDSIYIPAVGISQEDGNAIKKALKPLFPWLSKRQRLVFSSLFLDPRFRAGADASGHLKLYSPDPVEPGSSKSHWDTTATPNLLMEPFINDDLQPVDTLDLTPALFLDIGWTLEP